MIITIDGPTASGKSTVAKAIAKKLGIYHLNTGMLYRGIAYILTSKFKYDQEKLKQPEQKDIDQILNPKKFVYRFDGDNAYLSFNDEDITDLLKNREIDFYSSIISTNSYVRKSLLSLQRSIAENHDLVIEGRDCGSVVFPNAELKIFLTADLNVRAHRWQNYMHSKGEDFTIEKCIKIISDRDERDKKREISPLIIPENANVIDSSNLSENQVLDEIIKLYKTLKK
jgi:cytidylate kinase